ncbi:hypothetical protein DHW03_05090 [Pedobacter yonginense]|uniref:4'-phosphopantetheinyl transferase domain-containing protein n=1 Tax=Pedobacter yonginense TaxID=651869 RepID=A0A317EQN6_9SPHI|nr:4'-phosphopantetheinyl transferase superfamily protein [Pedobacter yonginense]PWS29200.1 hypothetical protein DHW03_05090 [Pedobacter yonginense]
MEQASIDPINWKDFREEEDLNIKETHVFCVSIEAYFNKISNYKAVLNDEEIAKSERYSHHHSKITYITSRYFARKILSQFTNGGIPSEICFKSKKNKKPAVDGIEFNSSHSGNLLLFVINASEVGVDIELMNENFDFSPLFENCFNDIEISTINQSENKILTFYQLWTRKEALLKATGEGLVDDLSSIDCLSNSVLRNNAQYQIQSFILEENYIASLAMLSNSTVHVNYWRY